MMEVQGRKTLFQVVVQHPISGAVLDRSRAQADREPLDLFVQMARELNLAQLRFAVEKARPTEPTDYRVLGRNLSKAA